MPFADTEVLTVSEVNAQVRALLEEEFPLVSVTGEVSNFRRHTSGHLYFTLKDESSQLRTVCFRSSARRVDVDMRDGLLLVVHGRLTVYEVYGQYQLVADRIEEAGSGALERRFRELVARLQEEGLFDEAHKQALPRYPERVAVVTSPTGAAIRDIISTVGRRWPGVDVLVAPVRVQGDLAPGEIIAALDALTRARGVDVIIVGRGGGSLEDLWAFNEEAVARAIHRCPVPVISAVGHESDVTIADFVADARAATPTAAAELAVPLRDTAVVEVERLRERLARTMQGMVAMRSQRLRELLRSYALGQVRGRIERCLQTLDYASDRLRRSVEGRLRERRQKLDAMLEKLDALNPSAVLGRGFAICMDPATGKLVRGVEQARAAHTLRVNFEDGGVLADVKETE